jgi:hypothetical protein
MIDYTDKSLTLADKAIDGIESLRRQRDTWYSSYENMREAYDTLKAKCSRCRGLAQAKGEQPMEQAMWDRIMQSDGEVHEDGVSADAFDAVADARKEDNNYYLGQLDNVVLELSRAQLELEELQGKYKSLERKHIITQASYLELYEKARAYLNAAEREGEIDESRDLRDLLCDESDMEKQIDGEGYDGS